MTGTFLLYKFGIIFLNKLNGSLSCTIQHNLSLEFAAFNKFT